MGNTNTNEAIGGCLSVGGIFAGIGGIESGLHKAGHHTEFLCEKDPAAAQVLKRHFVAPLHEDVTKLKPRKLPRVDLIAGGSPCQDLSQAGRTNGIEGERSSLVMEMFRVVGGMRPRPSWVLLENVPFMLRLDRGAAMAAITEELGRLGYTWAYRVVDTRAFGLPQRRQRVLLVASLSDDPREVLFADEAGPREFEEDGAAFGFYWTEGTRGLGWAVDSIPTLKGGSGLGIPSAPAIWLPDGRMVTPDIRDAERLQGFPSDWTRMPGHDKRIHRTRWRLVGNAVSVPVAKWVGQRLATPRQMVTSRWVGLRRGDRWPTAAWGHKSEMYAVPDITEWPVHHKYRSLASFLRFEPRPLSERALGGFRGRTKRDTCSLRLREDFLAAVDAYLDEIRA